MKRISVAILLMLLSSTAHASGYSFSIGGHFIHVEAGPALPFAVLRLLVRFADAPLASRR